mmetsp:Transcript_24824/g.77243  ORF Transcript_24824/g.77243 Transcript_24824/m.77243 type:complete len:249 (+) Transcript_24824:157-903(+)
MPCRCDDMAASCAGNKGALMPVTSGPPTAAPVMDKSNTSTSGSSLPHAHMAKTSSGSLSAAARTSSKRQHTAQAQARMFSAGLSCGASPRVAATRSQRSAYVLGGEAPPGPRPSRWPPQPNGCGLQASRSHMPTTTSLAAWSARRADAASGGLCSSSSTRAPAALAATRARTVTRSWSYECAPAACDMALATGAAPTTAHVPSWGVAGFHETHRRRQRARSAAFLRRRAMARASPGGAEGADGVQGSP